MLDFICIGFAELRGKKAKKSKCKMSPLEIEPVTLYFQPGALDHTTTLTDDKLRCKLLDNRDI